MAFERWKCGDGGGGIVVIFVFGEKRGMFSLVFL